MRAVTYHRYGAPEILRLEDVERPSIGEDGVLVRVHASSVNALDWHLLRGLPYMARATEGLRPQRTHIPGVDVGGVVEAVGSAVTTLQPGDEVIGHRGAAWAEYVVGKERHFVAKPANVSFEEAGALAGAATTALQGVRDKGDVRAGSRVLVTAGAGGGVGTFAVQISRALGAEVTATTNAASQELVRSLGATTVLDYAREDVTRVGRRFDVILDVAATSPLGDLARVLAPGGALVMVGAPKGDWVAPLTRILAGSLRARLRGQRMLPFLAGGSHADLETLRDMLRSGAVRPVVEDVPP